MSNKYDQILERQQLVDRYNAMVFPLTAATVAIQHQFIDGSMAIPDAQAFVRVYEYKIRQLKRFSFDAPD
jgi:hypothetical protein